MSQVVEGSIITDEEEEGVKMIQFLQKKIGKNEPYDTALKGWRGMSQREREITLETYLMLGGGEVTKCLNTSSQSSTGQ